LSVECLWTIVFLVIFPLIVLHVITRDASDYTWYHRKLFIFNSHVLHQSHLMVWIIHISFKLIWWYELYTSVSISFDGMNYTHQLQTHLMVWIIHISFKLIWWYELYTSVSNSFDGMNYTHQLQSHLMVWIINISFKLIWWYELYTSASNLFDGIN